MQKILYSTVIIGTLCILNLFSGRVSAESIELSLAHFMPGNYVQDRLVMAP